MRRDVEQFLKQFIVSPPLAPRKAVRDGCAAHASRRVLTRHLKTCSLAGSGTCQVNDAFRVSATLCSLSTRALVFSSYGRSLAMTVEKWRNLRGGDAVAPPAARPVPP